MADQSPPLHIEDMPLDEARRMGRGLRMDSVLSHALTGKLQS